jgi:micrococcal nuclease
MTPRTLTPLFTALALAGTAQADPCEAKLPKPGTVFSGKVVYVGDGDSLCVAGGNRQKSHDSWIEVRVADFYAPELNDPGGRAAKRTLERIAKGRRVVCVAGKRSYDRVVARCDLRGVSIGDRMRQAGVREGGRGR